MNYFTTDLYETKREIVIFSEKLASGLSKPECKFVMDMMFGLSRGQSVLLSDVSRALDENIKLRYTIERLSSHLNNMNDHEIELSYLEQWHSLHPELEINFINWLHWDWEPATFSRCF